MDEENRIKRKINLKPSIVGVKKIVTNEDLVEWFRCLFAYDYAKNRFGGKAKICLDIGCGSGYGVRTLSLSTRYVIGVDIWKDVVYWAKRKYDRSLKVDFVMALAYAYHLKNNSFDLITAFQLIEHIDSSYVMQFLNEVKRVLKDDGVFMLSTPNKKLRLLPLQKPRNPDHKKEYDTKELRELLENVFNSVKILGLTAIRNAYMIEYNRIKQNPFFVYVIHPMYTLLKRTSSTLLYPIERVRYTRKLNQKQKYAQTLNFEISLKSFRITTKYLDSCIDLYAICNKK